MIQVTFPALLKKVIEDDVVNSILNHPHTDAWYKEVASKLLPDKTFDNDTKDYHRKTLCGQGQADFRNGNFGLTTDDVSLLYSYYFFQMHFTSSVALYYKYSEVLIDVFQKSTTIHFVDIGCGPYTSGLSFLYFTQVNNIASKLINQINNTQIEYYGLDNSSSMKTLGSKILSSYSELLNQSNFQYNSVRQLDDITTLPRLINDSSADTTIILNCCYFFASNSLDINAFTAIIQQLIDNNPRCKILLLYQNAPTDAWNISIKYINFRDKVRGLTANGTNIEELHFTYNDEFRAAKRPTLNLRVRFQVLKNY